MKKFNTLYEEMMAGSGGVFGVGSDDISSGDWYATGDARLPKLIGVGDKPQKDKKKNKKKNKNKESIPLFRRAVNNQL